jgi:hypothetical protein
MDVRPCLSCHRATVALLMVLGLTGCGSVYTIYSIDPGDTGAEPSTVPDISGLWAVKNDESRDVVIRIRADDYDVGRCRSVVIQNLNTRTEGPVDEESAETWICFVPVGEYMIAESMGLGDGQLYVQSLFRADEQSISFCSHLWDELRSWSKEHPKKSSVYGIDFLRRGEFPEPDLIVTSSPEALLKYLEARLPQVNARCDEQTEDGSAWFSLVRLTPPRQPESSE